jgi:acetyl-CoA carboxylase carboxyltransferase component
LANCRNRGNGPQGAANIIFRKEIPKLQIQTKVRKQKVEEYKEDLQILMLLQQRLC